MSELIITALTLKPYVSFSSYFKYTFSFEGEVFLNGIKHHISASKGGCSDDIYKMEISAGVNEILDEESFNAITLTNSVTQEQVSWNNY